MCPLSWYRAFKTSPWEEKNQDLKPSYYILCVTTGSDTFSLPCGTTLWRPSDIFPRLRFHHQRHTLVTYVCLINISDSCNLGKQLMRTMKAFVVIIFIVCKWRTKYVDIETSNRSNTINSQIWEMYINEFCFMRSPFGWLCWTCNSPFVTGPTVAPGIQ